jgi:ketosteroid isomerase-like protein
MSDANKNVVRRLFEEVWTKGNLPVADQLFAPTYAHHDLSTPDFGRGPESEKLRATLYRTAFPDLRLTIEDLLAEGETVTARWSCHGTHKGDLGGIAPTGKPFAISGISIARFTNGKMVEGWVNWDALGLMQQLGIVPELAKAKVAAAAAIAR